MANGRKCKLTVIRRGYFPELSEKYAPVSIPDPVRNSRMGRSLFSIRMVPRDSGI